ncbi:DUF3800 domain-containing protein [Micromonospora provocatoris]
MSGKVILNFDESGNLGTKGRYFVIGCVITDNTKPLSNVLKKAVLKTKQTFDKYKNVKEIKAADSTPAIKDYFLRKISSKNVGVRYIVADKRNCKKALLDDENLLYNYLLTFVILPVARQKGVKELELNFDKRSIKVKSTNSFEDYIKIKLNFELGLDVKISVSYYESENNYSIQAADFVVNAIYSYYEHNYEYYYKILENIIQHSEKFPRSSFGKEIIKIS